MSRQTERTQETLVAESTLSLETDRLILRQWCDRDFNGFCEMNADPEVMRYFPKTLTESECREFMSKMSSLIREQGWGFWAVEIKASKEVIGFVGLNSPRTKLPFTPCVEVGWRLHKRYWGYGYATEAGKKSLEYGFTHLNLEEIVAFTTESNINSRKVMDRLGMKNTGENFRFPELPLNHPLSEHVLYKVTKSEWFGK